MGFHYILNPPRISSIATRYNELHQFYLYIRLRYLQIYMGTEIHTARLLSDVDVKCCVYIGCI